MPLVKRSYRNYNKSIYNFDIFFGQSITANVAGNHKEERPRISVQSILSQTAPIGIQKVRAYKEETEWNVATNIPRHRLGRH